MNDKYHTPKRIITTFFCPRMRPRWPSGKVLVGVVVRCWHQNRRVPGSKPDSTEDPSHIGPISRYIMRREPNVLGGRVVSASGPNDDSKSQSTEDPKCMCAC
ncbi:hypothetical protein AVEN_249204-1 [Araneus ventricosus]|uniref:Uncharacterized protein n=1 Tax=Araneus ventricosus TaxID=182803 RepID=A0A4Y2B3Y0_ARAVE|nr:hypothetical protein AVEN_249204-1 [Araneus ventricosus]